jgi:hypothetical protein
MGWASGSGIAREVYDLVRPFIPETERKAVAKKIIKIFESEDCDTMDECEVLMEDAE